MALQAQFRPRLRQFVPERNDLLGYLLTLGAAFCVLVVMVRQENLATRISQLIVAVAVVLVIARYPARAVMVLVPFLPFQVVLLAWLFKLGAPAGVVRGLGGVKEAVTLGVLIAGIFAMRREHRRLDLIDGAALVYLGMVTLYLLAPIASAGLLGEGPLNVRLLGWRQNCMFVLLFLGARHAPFTRAQRDRIVTIVIATGTAVAAIGVFEFFDSSAWNDFLVNVTQVPLYKAVVLNVFTSFSDQLTHGFAGNDDLIRIGSVLQHPVNLGVYLIVPFGLLLHRLTQRRIRTFDAVALGVISTALVLTITRSAILGALVIALVTVSTGVRLRAQGRVRLILVLLMAAVALAPFAGGSGVITRTTSAFTGQDESTTDHQQDLQEGLTTIGQHPLGQGLGTTAGVGDRFQVTGKVTSENAYIQVGNELGVITLIVFVVVLILIVMWLRRQTHSRDGPGDSAAAATYAIWIGLFITGFLQQIWIEFPFAMTAWLLAGLALRPDRGDAVEEPQPTHPTRRSLVAAGSSR